MVEGKPPGWVADPFVDGCRVQADGLVIGNIPPAFPVANEKFGVEAPGNHGVDDQLAVAVCIVRGRQLYKMPLSGGEPSAGIL